MKRTAIPFVGAMVALTVAAGALHAQGMHLATETPFESLDADGDGELTPTEMAAFRAARHAAIDTDGNGSLDLSELTVHMQAMAEGRAQQMLTMFDADGDGMLSDAEMPRPRGDGRLFKKADADGNGSLSKAEFDAAKARMMDRMRKHGSHKPGKN